MLLLLIQWVSRWILQITELTKILLKNQTQAVTYMVFTLREPDGAMTPISSQVVNQRNCSQSSQWCILNQFKTELFQRLASTCAHFTRCFPEQVLSWPLVTPPTLLSWWSCHPRKNNPCGSRPELPLSSLSDTERLLNLFKFIISASLIL